MQVTVLGVCPLSLYKTDQAWQPSNHFVESPAQLTRAIAREYVTDTSEAVVPTQQNCLKPYEHKLA